MEKDSAVVIDVKRSTVDIVLVLILSSFSSKTNFILKVASVVSSVSSYYLQQNINVSSYAHLCSPNPRDAVSVRRREQQLSSQTLSLKLIT